MELLEVWRTQIIEACIYKAENNIADVSSEIELALADMEIVEVKTESRAQTFIEKKESENNSEPKPSEPKNDQLTLF